MSVDQNLMIYVSQTAAEIPAFLVIVLLNCSIQGFTANLNCSIQGFTANLNCSIQGFTANLQIFAMRISAFFFCSSFFSFFVE